MQRTPTLSAEQQSAAKAQQSRVGPRPLDLSEFKFVSGGAPKNGWPEPVTTSTVGGPVDAPKNGW